MNLKLGQFEKSVVRLPQKQVITYERAPGGERPTPAVTFEKLTVVEVVEIISEEVKANPEAYERIGEALGCGPRAQNSLK
jgi:hypothetical protein